MPYCRKSIVAAVLLLTMSTVHARGPWRASEGNTAGWHFMSPEERIEHQARVRGFTNYAECQAYQQEHHHQMAARALAQGLQLRPGRRDICAHLRPPEPDAPVR